MGAACSSLTTHDESGDQGQATEVAPTVVGCVFQQVGFQVQPQLKALVELCRLRGSVGVVEGVLVRGRHFGSGVAQTAEARRTRCPRSMSLRA